MDEIRKTAKELGMMIRNTKVYRDYDKYMRELENNPELSGLLSDYEVRAGMLSMRQKSGETLAPFEIEEIREITRRINEEDQIMQYLNAREQYLGLIMKVQEELKKTEHNEGPPD